MNVSLTPELERLVHLKVTSGRYRSASEVIREALQLMEERDQAENKHKAWIRDAIDAGMTSFGAGKDVDGETFMAQMQAELAELERQGR
jgi:antitoxin ParD1/3/4